MGPPPPRPPCLAGNTAGCTARPESGLCTPRNDIRQGKHPELAFNWRVILATVIGFFGSAFGTVGGGGGGIFVPMLNLVVGFDTKSVVELFKCMIMGASTSSVWYNLRVPHPTKEQEYVKQQDELSNSVHIDAYYDLLVPQEEKSGLKILRFNLRWKGILVLMIVWLFVLLLQVIKNFTKDCSLWYWVLNFMQILALFVYGFEAVKLYKESKKRRMNGNMESVCEATIQWSALQFGFCALLVSWKVQLVVF